MKAIIHNNFKKRATLGAVIVLITSTVLLVCASFRQSDLWERPSSVKVLKFYPNPATSYINFEFSQETDKSYNLLVFNFVGKKMTEMPVENNKLIVPLTGYYRGLYVFQLKDKTGRIIETGRFQVIQ